MRNDGVKGEGGEKLAEEQLAFARKASGLVRGLSMWDAFGVGFMNQGLTPSIVVMTSLGVGVYTGGNMVIAVLLSVLLAGIGMPIVWGVLGGSMPRSGGEYIYNSRIIHPIIGIAESFGNAFVWIMWIYVLAPWVADPGFTMLASFTGAQGLADWATQPYATFILATIANIIAFLFVVFGIKIFARAQKIIMAIGIGGCVVLCVILSAYAGGFESSWNEFAAKHNSLDYNAFLAGVQQLAGRTMPTTWNWFDSLGVMVAASWAFAYAYCMAFIAGEVKRPDKTIILANLFAVVVPGVFCLWTAIALYQVDFNFLSAAFWLDNSGETLKGLNLPFSTNYVSLAYIMQPNTVFGVTAIAALIFPYRKRARHIWESSPYRNWKLFGIPVVTLGAFVDLIYLAILFVFFFIMPDLRDFTTTGVVFFASIWVLGILWYFYWKWRSSAVGVSTSVTYGELPPE